MKALKTLEDYDFKGQRVFLRLDLNVPLKEGKISDDSRIQAALPGIEYLRSKGARLVLASHLGRPKGERNPKYSLEPVAARLSELLSCEVILIEDPAGEPVKGLLNSLREDQVLLLENLRFDPREEKNGGDLAHEWASFTDIYVNDAFGASHRAHASIVALPQMLTKRAVGPLIQKETEALDKLIKSPPRPFVALLGGAKVSDKVGLVESLLDRVDIFLIGGAMAYTFLAALDIPTGKSLVEKDKVKLAKELLQRVEARKKTLRLPLDHIVAPSLDQSDKYKVTEGVAIPEGTMALDIGPKTRADFAKFLAEAKTVFWNGPMGLFEKKPMDEGTLAMAKSLASLEGVYKVVGGGDSVAAVQQCGLADSFDHVSTGGGASLEYLEQGELPGIQVLRL